MVFSISSRISFDRINQINDSLLSALGNAIEIPRVLVGSMLDLTDQRQVSYRVSWEIGCCMFYGVCGMIYVVFGKNYVMKPDGLYIERRVPDTIESYIIIWFPTLLRHCLMPHGWCLIDFTFLYFYYVGSKSFSWHLGNTVHRML